MAPVTEYRRIIERVLADLTRIPYAYGDLQAETIFDPTHDRYLVMTVGWDGAQRIHHCLIHLDVLDGKIWVQRDSTEHGIATDLAAAGIPKDHIVLAFQPPELRPYTDYAAA